MPETAAKSIEVKENPLPKWIECRKVFDAAKVAVQRDRNPKTITDFEKANAKLTVLNAPANDYVAGACTKEKKETLTVSGWTLKPSRGCPEVLKVAS